MNITEEKKIYLSTLFFFPVFIFFFYDLNIYTRIKIQHRMCPDQEDQNEDIMEIGSLICNNYNFQGL